MADIEGCSNGTKKENSLLDVKFRSSVGSGKRSVTDHDDLCSVSATVTRIRESGNSFLQAQLAPSHDAVRIKSTLLGLMAQDPIAYLKLALSILYVSPDGDHRSISLGILRGNLT